MEIKSDRKVGEDALHEYFKEAKRLFPENMKVSFDEFLKLIDLKSKSYIMGLGLGIKMAEISQSNIEDAMESLARNAQGKIPDDVFVFTQAIIKREKEFDWQAFKEVSKQSLEDAALLAQEIGEDAKKGLKGTFKAFAQAKYLLPILAGIGVVAFFKYNSISKLKK